MSELKKIRELKNLTQEELAQQTGLSVRTIQRVEAGMQPKGYTLKTLAAALDIAERDLFTPLAPAVPETIAEELPEIQESTRPVPLALIKIINLSSLPLAWFPVANCIPPVLIMLFTKEKSPVIKQIISLQAMIAIISPMIFMVIALLKLGSPSVMVTMVLLVLTNIFVILRNAYELDTKGCLYYKLNFNIL